MNSNMSVNRSSDEIFKNINSINVEVITEIQKDLTTYDVRSLVFLIYDDGLATAIERLTLLQRVSKDMDCPSLDTLYDWAVRAQASASWRYLFLEALTICQLYGIIRKLGFDVAAVKSYYSPDNLNIHIHINPIKKVLYKMGEAMDRDMLLALKKALLTHDIDITNHEASELVFLDLLQKKFITMESAENLACIVERMYELNSFSSALRQVEERSKKSIAATSPHTSGTMHALTTHQKVVEDNLSTMKPTTSTPAAKNNNMFTEGFDDIFDILDVEEKLLSLHLKSDRKQMEGAYEIKDPKRIGVAYIINQEKFYPSKLSLKADRKTFRPLHDRCGSVKDKQMLQHVLKSYKFDVYTDDNLDSTEMFVKIKELIRKKVTSKDSIFILCILSHGIKGEVFAADSVSVKVEDIQNLLDSSEAMILRGMPKVLIIQSCQVVDDKPALTLVADGPSALNSPKPNYYLRKSDYIIYWATAPEYEAFRDTKKGSIFIQTLCFMINKWGAHEHLLDIFTKVNSTVKRICLVPQKAQLPIFECTLEKKLYLCLP